MSSKRDIIAKHKIESVARSQHRKVEQAMLQLNSCQPLSKAQQKLPSEEVELYKNVNLQHFPNNVDYAWNNISNMPKKQLDNVFLPTAIAGLQTVYCTVKKKIIAEQAKKEQQKAERLQKNKEKHEQFEERKIKNEQIYAKLGLKKTYQSSPATQNNQEPLFERLSKPKQSFIQQSTYDLPDFRGFAIKNLNFIDKQKNPTLINHFANSNLLPKSVFKEKISKKFETSELPPENLHNTIQIDELNMDLDFKDNALNEIDEFEKMISTMPQTMYSQVKDRENQLLQSVNGFKSIKQIRNNPNYRHLIGNQIREMVLMKS